MNLIRHFIIGSSFPVIFSFYLKVLEHKNKNYKFKHYVFIAPIYFGLYNIMAHLIGNKLKWNLRKRLWIFSLLSAMTTIIYATISKSYNFNNKDWYKYYLRLIIKYIMIWNIIIYNLEKLI
jgi:hypothetical protein